MQTITVPQYNLIGQARRDYDHQVAREDPQRHFLSKTQSPVFEPRVELNSVHQSLDT